MSSRRPQSAPSKKKEPGILLGRNSSARALIKKKSSSSILDEADQREILEKGGTPHEDALLVMQMIYEGCGKDPTTIAGLSTLDKLQSFRTEPALEILKNTTWRNFFASRNNQNNTAIINHMRPKSASSATKLNRSIPQSKHQKTLEDQQRKLFENISATFDRMIARVEMLWNALNLPESDRLFYKQSLCKGPPTSMDHCREVAQYIAMLQIHRNATINVLKAIESREVYVKRCYDVIAALTRKNSRRETPTSSFNDDSISLWRQELIISLKDVQISSLNVIKNIQIWRKNLWRPQPFMWKGSDGVSRDYLLKMKSDMNVLDSSIYSKQLKLCGLSTNDLVCIVFELKNKEIDSGDSPNTAQITEIEKYKKILSERVDANELQQAVNIVLSESNLRTALALESESLLAKGVFIPTLKLLSHEKNNKQSHQQHQQQQVNNFEGKYEEKYESPSNTYQDDFYNS